MVGRNAHRMVNSFTHLPGVSGVSLILGPPDRTLGWHCSAKVAELVDALDSE